MDKFFVKTGTVVVSNFIFRNSMAYSALTVTVNQLSGFVETNSFPFKYVMN